MEDGSKFDVEREIKDSFPIIFEILGPEGLSGKDWATIKESYDQEKGRRQALNDKGDAYFVEVNFYDLIYMREHGNRRAYVFLDMFKNALEELCDSLDRQGKLLLRKTIKSILESFDHKHRNFIGELLVLNNAVKHQQFELLRIEFPIVEQSKKGEKPPSADFLLKDKTNGNLELVEIVNIHVDDKIEDIHRFITGKLVDKIADKTKGKTEYKKFTLVPVIWASYKMLRRIEKLYIDGNGINVPSTLIPCAFASFDYADDFTEFKVKFGTITTLFVGENIAEDA